MKIDLDIAIISLAFLCLLSYIFGALSVDTEQDKFHRQQKLEQHAILNGNAIEA